MDKQYLELLRTIKEKGTYKPPAREGMPGSLSLFGYQMRHNLSEGFPILTTKKIYWKGVVTELLWFLRGDTNIKYLVDNGVNIWNEDAYNYYSKRFKDWKIINKPSFESFIEQIKGGFILEDKDGYKFGDCGFQYGKVWRDWEGSIRKNGHELMYNITNDDMDFYSTSSVERILNDELKNTTKIDQIANVIKSLKETPESRRHIVTAIDPAHDQDLALYWCHALFQFNCRPLTNQEKLYYLIDAGKAQFAGQENEGGKEVYNSSWSSTKYHIDQKDWESVPKYYLDCQLYQRSADVVLG